MECGDGTNLTVSFAGGLLSNTEELLRMGLHTSEVILGYKKAGDKLVDEILPSLLVSKLKKSQGQYRTHEICQTCLGRQAVQL